MYYKVFPFGKYKGVKLTDLPSTYIVLALEQYELPDELTTGLRSILFGRLKVYSLIKKSIKEYKKAEHLSILQEMIDEYELSDEFKCPF